jgi:hypothetical protein
MTTTTSGPHETESHGSTPTSPHAAWESSFSEGERKALLMEDRVALSAVGFSLTAVVIIGLLLTVLAVVLAD